MGGKKDLKDPAPGDSAKYGDDPEFSLVAQQRRSDDVSGQHAEQDEAQHAARQPQVEVQRPRYPPVMPVRRATSGAGSSKALVGSHRRAAAEHVLQHRHCHHYVWVRHCEPQARAPQGEGALIDATQYGCQQEHGKKNARAIQRRWGSASDAFLAFSRKRCSPRSFQKARSVTGRSSDRPAGTVSSAGSGLMTLRFARATKRSCSGCTMRWVMRCLKSPALFVRNWRSRQRLGRVTPRKKARTETEGDTG